MGGASRVSSTKVQILTCFTSTKVQILTCLGEKGGHVPSEVVLVGGASRVPKILSNLHKTVAALGQSVQVLLYQESQYVCTSKASKLSTSQHLAQDSRIRPHTLVA